MSVSNPVRRIRQSVLQRVEGVPLLRSGTWTVRPARRSSAAKASIPPVSPCAWWYSRTSAIVCSLSKTHRSQISRTIRDVSLIGTMSIDTPLYRTTNLPPTRWTSPLPSRSARSATPCARPSSACCTERGRDRDGAGPQQSSVPEHRSPTTSTSSPRPACCHVECPSARRKGNRAALYGRTARMFYVGARRARGRRRASAGLQRLRGRGEEINHRVRDRPVARLHPATPRSLRKRAAPFSDRIEQAIHRTRPQLPRSGDTAYGFAVGALPDARVPDAPAPVPAKRAPPIGEAPASARSSPGARGRSRRRTRRAGRGPGRRA